MILDVCISLPSHTHNTNKPTKKPKLSAWAEVNMATIFGLRVMD